VRTAGCRRRRSNWAKTASQAEAVVVESHSPPLLDAEAMKAAAPLFDEGEAPQLRGPGENTFVPYDSEKVEKKY